MYIFNFLVHHKTSACSLNIREIMQYLLQYKLQFSEKYIKKPKAASALHLSVNLGLHLPLL